MDFRKRSDTMIGSEDADKGIFFLRHSNLYEDYSAVPAVLVPNAVSNISRSSNKGSAVPNLETTA